MQAREPAQPAEPVRYRCGLCGNLTRFDVLERKRTRSYYHFSIGGTLRVEEEEVLEREVERVVCRWCNASDHVEVVPALEASGEPAEPPVPRPERP